MIQSHELMIGNYLNYIFPSGRIREVVVETIGEYGINIDSVYEHGMHSIECDYSLEGLHGIPITEQWLLDFGFEKWEWCLDTAFKHLFLGESFYCRYYSGVWHIERKKIGRDSTGLFVKSQGKPIVPKGRIKYIHQLQNLYFALTGEQLKKK